MTQSVQRAESENFPKLKNEKEKTEFDLQMENKAHSSFFFPEVHTSSHQHVTTIELTVREENAF